jgi:hypothetical protein
LRELDQWVSRYRQLWPQKLDALAEHLDRTRGPGTGQRGRRR